MAGRLNFSDYNFDSLVQQLRNIVQQKAAWIDINIEAGTGNFLIELFSYVAEMLMYYLERRAQETYIDTAQLDSSVRRLVSLLNYRPKRKTSSIGSLEFSVGSLYPADINLPFGTVVETVSGTPFIVAKQGFLAANSFNVILSGIQGLLVNVTAVSDGTPSFSVVIDDVDVENSDETYGRDPTISVVIDDVLWELVDTFVGTGANDKVYTQQTLLDGTTKLVFGDGVFGAIPDLNLVVHIQYLQSAGLSGNVYSPGAITVLGGTIYDINSVEVTSLVSVTNTTEFLGGDDEESTDEIRENAPLVFKTGQRAVTREDFIAILQDIPGIATAYASGERDVLPDYWANSTVYYVGGYVTDVNDNTVWQCGVDNTSGTGTFAADRTAHPSWWNSVFRYANITQFNKVKLVVLLQDWIIPDNAFKIQIVDVIKNKEQLTVWLEFVDPNIVDTIVDMDLKALPTYQVSTIVTNVGVALDAIFKLGVVKLGVPVRLDDVIAAVEAVVGVDYTHVAFRQRELMGIGDGGETYFSKTLSLIPVLPRSFNLYQNATLIGTDDGANNIVSALGSGTIDYASGLAQFTFSGTPPPLYDNIYAYYKQDKQGDIVPDKVSIARLIQKNINIL